MSEFVLSCCSTADLPRRYFEETGIPFLPFHVHLEGKDYLDDLGDSLPLEDFYARMKAGTMPTTSQVNVEEYLRFFEPFLQGGQDVLHLAFSSGLSGSCQSAQIAREELCKKYPDRKLFVLDSLSASAGYGLLVDAAFTLRKGGATIDELVRKLSQLRGRVQHWFFSTDLTAFKRGGRISPTAAVVGGLLGICPLLDVDPEGRLRPRAKVRGKKNVVREIVERMKETAQSRLGYAGKCFVSHSACPGDARQVADLVEKTFPHLDGPVRVSTVGTVIGAHTGPGTVALFFVGDERAPVSK
jgi:DegV family protein with EDD domain